MTRAPARRQAAAGIHPDRGTRPVLPEAAQMFLVFVAGFAVSALRPLQSSQRFTLFGEDGTIFTTQVRSRGVVRSLFTTYAGYFHLIPRVVADVASAFALQRTPEIYSLGAWAVAAAAGAVSWQCARGLRLPAAAAGVVASSVVLLPAAGYEVVDTITYVEWYCAAAAVVFVAAWIGGYRPSLWAVVPLVIIGGGTTPLMVVLVPFGVAVWLLAGRRRYDLAVAGSLVAGSLIEVVGRLVSHLPGSTQLLPRSMFDTFLVRAVDGGLAGKAVLLHLYPRLHPVGAALAGLVIFVGLATAGTLELKGRTLLVFWFLLLQAALLTVLSEALRPQAAVDGAGVGFWAGRPALPLPSLLQVGGRYYAVPGVCLVAAAALWLSARRSRAVVGRGALYRVGMVALAACLAFNVRIGLGRQPAQVWQGEVAAARAQCQETGGRSGVSVVNSPGAPWAVTLTCAQAFGGQATAVGEVHAG